jgi:type IX secretion system substrate protein
MEKKITFRIGKTLSRALIAFFAMSVLFMVGCYEFSTIDQPVQAEINEFFDVQLVAKDDGNPDNDWTAPDLQNTGLFGVMLPDGWTVANNIPYFIVSTDPTYNNNGFLVFSAEHTATLQDSIATPPGYHWWGAKTAGIADMYMFDSLYFQPRITTDDKVGTFFLRYAIGDEDYWDRNPADDISDPIQIEIIDHTGVNEVLSKENVVVYPNPSNGRLNVDFDYFNSQAIDMQIIDLSGRVMVQKQLFQSSNQLVLEDIPEGVYFVRLTDSKQQSNMHKIILH